MCIYVCRMPLNDWQTLWIAQKRWKHKVIGGGSIPSFHLGPLLRTPATLHVTHLPASTNPLIYPFLCILCIETCRALDANENFLKLFNTYQVWHTSCVSSHQVLKPPSHGFPSVAIRLPEANRRDHQADQTPCDIAGIEKPPIKTKWIFGEGLSCGCVG